MKQNKIPRNEYIRKPVGKTNPYKHDVLYTNLGQWKYPGQVTKIPANDITMQGVDYPVYGEDDLGYGQMMYPGMDYQFPGQYVTETPMAQKGKQVEDRDSWLENIAEVFDPTGLSSWDDVYRAYKNTGLSGETAKEVLGAIPLLGKVGKLAKTYNYLAKTPRQAAAINRFNNVMQLGALSGRGSDAFQAALGAKDNSGFTWDIRHGEVPKYGGRNIFPQIELGEHGDFAYGGDPSLPNIEGHYPFGGQNTKTHTHMKEGGWLDELEEGGSIGEDEFRRGGPYTPPKLKKKAKKYGTSKNIQSSINKLFTRNYDVFGPGGKNIYNPNVYKTGGWLDFVD